MSLSAFNEVLAAAVDDLAEHGFDSEERVTDWAERLRRAAQQAMLPQDRLEKMLREAMTALYRRLIERGGIATMHPGVSRYTIDRLRPELKTELERRILSNVNLIKLNREQEMAAMLRRFYGWATSVPAGGTDAPGVKKEAKEDIRKSLSGLSFRERRVMTDQGIKLTSALNDVVATGGGAIAAIWHSHWRQANYNFREDHKERDKVLYVLRDNWAMQKGLMKLAGHKYSDQMTQPGEEVYCFPGDSRVPYADGVTVGYRRWFDGDLTELITKSGKTLQATPNHPVLTPQGWIAIGALNEGDYIIEIANQRIEFSEHHKNAGASTIAEIFSALLENGASQMVRGKLDDFHGDGRSNSDIDVVFSDRPLTFGRNGKVGQQLSFALSDYLAATIGAIFELFFCCACSASRAVRGLGEAFAPGFSFATHAMFVGGADRSYLDACAFEHQVYRPSTDTVFASKIASSNSGYVLATKIGKVKRLRRFDFSGHVYNLQTRQGWYAAEGIISHNCRCYYQYVYTIDDLPKEMLTQAGKDALKRRS